MADLELTAHWEGGYRMRTEVRSMEVRADEPPEYNGDDTGPMPTELFLASLASCFGMAIVHAGRKRGIDLPDLDVKVTGTYQGLRFARIRVEVVSSHPRDELEPLLERAINYCYVSNTLRTPPAMEFVVAG
ncbi:MAG TPA: OsmC family protein [Actinomycetota bacterium]|nr:OsmC family protein [Actinomycetota bacterium]